MDLTGIEPAQAVCQKQYATITSQAQVHAANINKKDFFCKKPLLLTDSVTCDEADTVL